MPWTWVRPADPSVLEGRPLLDLGCGDGQTLATLVPPGGLVVGCDHRPGALRAASRSVRVALVAGDAGALPFVDGAFEVVLCGDLFHHLDDGSLMEALRGIRRVLRPGGRLVAWWFGAPGRGGPDVPAQPRPLEAVEAIARTAGLRDVRELAVVPVEPGPATVGLEGRV